MTDSGKTVLTISIDNIEEFKEKVSALEKAIEEFKKAVDDVVELQIIIDKKVE